MCFALSGLSKGKYLWGSKKAENTEEMCRIILNSEISLDPWG